MEREEGPSAHLDNFDVVVIGAGHAGIEAAVASARLGARTALFTLTLDGVGNLPCNPSIGGTAKGQLVREIDALGGVMGLAADATFLQSRMLNTGKGPAVQSLRVQTDRRAYHQFMKEYLEKVPNLFLKQAEITDILTEDGKITAVETHLGARYGAKAVVVATGTYLAGKIYVGDAAFESGPDGQHAAKGLSNSLRHLGVSLRRFKTGTPARVNRRSIDFSKLAVQEGDAVIEPFSFLTTGELKNQVVCHIAHTNDATHEVIRQNIHRSPLYGGKIEGVGPRYCPSLEDKVMRFADKNSHQTFIEPCGLTTDEMYLQGMSSSLPEAVQNDFYHTIPGLEHVEIMRPAYAIEYDCCDPLQLDGTLVFMHQPGLYGAGQFNGTSGYEEAAGQGLLAGVNAARWVQGKMPVLLPRQGSYIGTLVDDLITKGVSDPYRMMTSRSEHRMFLRQDNADRRMTPLGREIGLVDDARWAAFTAKEAVREAEMERLANTMLKKEQINPLLERLSSAPVTQSTPALELLRRPEVRYTDLQQLLAENPAMTPLLVSTLETDVKYEGYIQRQQRRIAAEARQENAKIPEGFHYSELKSLRMEAREKLARVRPHNIGQAGRIPGVSPADISVLLVELALRQRKSAAEKATQNREEAEIEKKRLLSSDDAAALDQQTAEEKTHGY